MKGMKCFEPLHLRDWRAWILICFRNYLCFKPVCQMRGAGVLLCCPLCMSVTHTQSAVASAIQISTLLHLLASEIDELIHPVHVDSASS